MVSGNKTTTKCSLIMESSIDIETVIVLGKFVCRGVGALDATHKLPGKDYSFPAFRKKIPIYCKISWIGAGGTNVQLSASTNPLHIGVWRAFGARIARYSRQLNDHSIKSEKITISQQVVSACNPSATL